MEGKRFITTFTQRHAGLIVYSVIVDRLTGVNYLNTDTGLTPLLDKDGKIIITGPETRYDYITDKKL